MARHGFIRGKLDIKLLILCFLSNVNSMPVTFDHLTELSITDGAIDYFDFCQALSELIESGHVVKDADGKYSITPKGADNYRFCEDDFVRSVRRKAEDLAADVVDRIQRSELIHCSCEPREDGSYTVHLRLNDDDDNILAIDMMVANQHQARKLTDNFRKNAEKVYNSVLTALSDVQD